MKIGVVACRMMHREIDIALKKFPEIDEVVYIREGEHVNPKRLREQVIAHLKAMKEKVDVIFLGYGHCHSLKDIGDEIDIQVVHPEADDCIAILLTPERYKQEVANTKGTWFMTPGWAVNGKSMLKRELKSFTSQYAGLDEKTVVKQIFEGYSRGLYIDTGVENNDYFVDQAEEMCDTLELDMEQTTTQSTILEDSLAKCVEIAKELKAKEYVKD